MNISFKPDKNFSDNLVGSMDLRARSTEKTKQNLQKLATRKKGEHLYIDTQGALKTLKGIKKIKYFFKDLFAEEGKTSKDRLRDEISSLVGLLGTKSLEDAPSAQAIKQFLTQSRMRNMSQRIFDRSAIKKTVFYSLSEEKNLQFYKERKHHIKQIILNTPEKATHQDRMEVADLRHKAKMEKVRITQQLGVDLVINGTGFTGSYKGKSIYKTVASIKPVNEDQDHDFAPKKAKVKTYFFELFGIQRRTCLTAGEGVHAEVGASKFSNALELSTVPDTRLVDMKSDMFIGKEKNKKASFQEWIKEKFEMAKDFKDWKKIARDPIQKAQFQQEFEDFVLVDFGINGLDTHELNWLIIKQEAQDKAPIYKIKLFDNGLSMPHTHPSDSFALRNMYKWRLKEKMDPKLKDKYYPANWAFSQHAKDKMQLLKEKLPKICEDLLKHYSDTKSGVRDPSRAEAKINRMLERLEVMNYYIQQGYSPADLANDMRTPEDYIRFFREHPELKEIRQAAGMPWVNNLDRLEKDHPVAAKRVRKTI